MTVTAAVTTKLPPIVAIQMAKEALDQAIKAQDQLRSVCIAHAPTVCLSDCRDMCRRALDALGD